MEYLGDKLHSVTGEAVSEVRKKWHERSDSNKNGDVQTVPTQSAIPMERARLRPMHSPNPLAQGIQFGAGDSYSNRQPQVPPTIGFRTDLLLNQPQYSGQHSGQQVAVLAAPDPEPAGQDKRLDVSSESLYQGDTWARLWFQRVMVLCLLRLLLFIRKVYEDFQATKVYSLTGQRGHFLIAATTLFMPTLMFTVYRVARYLQLALPSFRANKTADEVDQSPASEPAPDVGASRAGRREASSRRGHDDDDVLLRRALMSSPDQSAGMATPVPINDDGGLVTARQTPTEEFHDSKSQQESIVDSAAVQETSETPPRPPPRRSNEDPQPLTAEASKLESVNVDKLGDLPDRDTVRVFIGASEHLLHGVLFIFWQLKRQVDVMGYLVERACLWRKPAEREKDELNRLNCHRDGLEWFQDFYAAFLAILAQVYTLGLHWASSDSNSDHAKQLSASQLSAATSGLASSETMSDAGSSQSARVVSSLLGLQAALAGKDVLIMSELIVSSAVVLSLLICVRRRDDGPLTLALSMLGWGSLFAARIIIIALAFVHIGWLVMLPLIGLHVFATTGWLYLIALDSHNGRASELDDEAKWDEEAASEQRQQSTEGIELNSSSERAATAPPTDSKSPRTPEGPSPRMDNQTQAKPRVTSSWSALEHVVLLAQILTLFAIPSLFYWPIMFNLKLHLRPFKYLVIVLIQNFLLIPGVWFAIGASVEPTLGQLYLLGAVGAFSIVGFVFVSLYIACKPSLTEYFARADELFNEAEKSGIYFEFCSRVFKMPDLSTDNFKRLMDQSEQREEVLEVDETSSPVQQQESEAEQIGANNAIRTL